MKGDTTLLVKTFDRPDCLDRLLASIKRHLPEVSVWVGDDSPQPYPEVCVPYENVEYIRLPVDCGLSAGRNYLVDYCPTSYAVMLDDDFVITGNVDSLVEYVRQGIFDIAGGSLRLESGKPYHFQGWLSRQGETLECQHSQDSAGPQSCEVVLNFLAFRVDVVRRVRWDDELKLGEHLDFFLRCREQGVKVGYVPHVLAAHLPPHRPEYTKKKHEKAQYYRMVWRRKRGFEEIGATH